MEESEIIKEPPTEYSVSREGLLIRRAAICGYTLTVHDDCLYSMTRMPAGHRLRGAPKAKQRLTQDEAARVILIPKRSET